jgi:hypothetical protein
VGAGGWEEAGLGLVKRVSICTGDQASATAQDGGSRAADAGWGGGGVSKPVEGSWLEWADQYFVYQALESDDSTECIEIDPANVGLAIYSSEQVEHLEWWRMYYHFVRYHESLKVNWDN